MKKLGINLQWSIKLARKLHAPFVQYEHILASTRHANQNKNTRYDSGALGPRAARNPPDPH
eukprot:1156139-Pelagomonas_calceolata.AAC.7